MNTIYSVLSVSYTIYSRKPFSDLAETKVLRTRDNVRPVFVSPGHKVDFESAIGAVLACCRGYRLPEPTRQAHIEAGKLKRRMLDDVDSIDSLGHTLYPESLRQH